ncbi:hypothetical protein CA13_01800 [Planctomycetes bacterium CA13]|uniref:VTT domain-containing protein n=1 Tax=Novipirellula herctigrandis TaxID=2527986 RepID=A0A5C5YVX2_9BACT|nr:hypothetical protein CA13_01800 [Planctomycetes bacterium CA13]
MNPPAIMLVERFLSWIAAYGEPMLALAVFLVAVGVPMPSTLFVIAGGAFVRTGVMEMTSTFILLLVAVVLGDTVSYGMGRLARRNLQDRFQDNTAWQRAQLTFQKRGGIAVYLTRWILTPFAIPTNLAAGSGGYPLIRFLFCDIAGELTWIIVFGGLGYAFGSQWEVIAELVSNCSGLLAGIVFLVIGVYLYWKRLRPNRALPKP